MSVKLSPQVVEDRCRTALKDLPYIEDVWIDTEDMDTFGDNFLTIHIAVDESAVIEYETMIIRKRTKSDKSIVYQVEHVGNIVYETDDLADAEKYCEDNAGTNWGIE